MPITVEPPIAVLLTEDEPLVRMVAADVLTEEGYRVIEASSADEALVLLEARPDVSVLVTDVHMPGVLDGSGLARIVARRWPDVGVIICSGRSIPGDGDLLPGVVFLPKPYSPSILLHEVRAMLNRRKASVAAAIRPEEAVVVPDGPSATTGLVTPAQEPAPELGDDAG
jgi:CheY-like chemotaxis protein